jgi:excisionase family DNA binding protein
MNLSILPLKQLLELLKAKEWLQTKLDEVNHDLQRLENGNVSAPSAMEVQALEKNANESEKILSGFSQGVVLARKAAAQYIGCGLTKFDSLVKGGRIKAVSYDEHCRFRRETLDQFLRENER